MQTENIKVHDFARKTKERYENLSRKSKFVKFTAVKFYESNYELIVIRRINLQALREWAKARGHAYTCTFASAFEGVFID